MTALKRDGFPLFLRTHVRPVLKDRGYRLSGQVATKRAGAVSATLAFIRYTGGLSGRFDVRMSITLAPYCNELGVVAGSDLSIRTYGSVFAAPWRWPIPAPDWPAAAATLVPAIVEGTTWLESLLDLRALAEHLDSQRYVSPEADTEAEAALARMQAAGIKTLHSPRSREPRAGRIRPHKVKALSYCYELLEAWPQALEAWTANLSTFQDLGDSDHPAVRAALARRAYLEEKCAGRPTTR